MNEYHDDHNVWHLHKCHDTLYRNSIHREQKKVTTTINKLSTCENRNCISDEVMIHAVKKWHIGTVAQNLSIKPWYFKDKKTATIKSIASKGFDLVQGKLKNKVYFKQSKPFHSL